MRSKDVEGALKQVIQNLVAADETPCSLSAVRVFFYEMQKNTNFQKPCVSATLDDARIPISLLRADRQKELKALAANIDATHGRERVDLANEFNDLAQRAIDLAARDEAPPRKGAKPLSAQRAAEEPAKDYAATAAAIQIYFDDKRKHLDDVSSFHRKSTAYVKRVHDEFLTKSGN